MQAKIVYNPSIKNALPSDAIHNVADTPVRCGRVSDVVTNHVYNSQNKLAVYYKALHNTFLLCNRVTISHMYNVMSIAISVRFLLKACIVTDINTSIPVYLFCMW